MERKQLVGCLWTEVILDEHLVITELIDADQRVLWGKSNVSECVGQPLKTLAADTCTLNKVQMAKLEDAIRRACAQKRPVYEEYTSTFNNGQLAYIGAHIRLVGQAIRILLIEIHPADYLCLDRGQVSASSLLESFLPDIYENLPIGLEVYDNDGRLVEMNRKEMELLGIVNKSDALGVNLFDNPNLSEEMRTHLLAGENVRSTIQYDYNKAKTYFNCVEVGSRHLDVLIFIIRNKNGAVDKYLIVVQDKTDYVSLYKEYERVSNEAITILESLPVGVELYNPAGQLMYLNDTDCRIFNVNKEDILASVINIADNPNLPDVVKEAVRNGKRIHVNFPYSFTKIAEKDYYYTAQAGTTRQIDCNGVPILNSAGELEKYVFIVDDITESIQVEQELRQSRQKEQLAMKATGIMLWEFDPEKRWFVSENESFNNYTSFLPILLDKCLNPFHPDDREPAMALIERMIAGEDFSFTKEVRAKYIEEEEWQYCTICAAPYARNAEGKIIRYVGSCKNNSELIRQRMFQEKVLNSISIPIHIKDISDNFRYVFCNEESKRVLGTCEGKRVHDLVGEKLASRIQQADLETFATGKSSVTKERVLLRDGRSYDTMAQRSVIYDGNKRLLLTVRRDQSLLNDLSRKAKVLSLSMSALNAYPWFYDHSTAMLTLGEDFDQEGRDSTKLTSIPQFAECIHEDDRQKFLDNTKQALSKDTGDFSVEYRVDLSNSGNYEWWECRGVVETVIFGDVSYKYMYGMDVNIDAHKKVEFTLLEAKLLAEQSDKLKSAFLANMSHEIRTPLNAIVGFSDLLMHSTELDEKEEYMHIINTNNELLLKLISDILDLSKIEAGAVELTSETFDLAYYFDSVASAMMQRVRNPLVDLVVTKPYESCVIQSDRNRIAQILINYATNAIKYTPQGVIEMGYEVVEVGVRFYVKDTGIGIPDEKKNRVFHRFEKLDEFAQGTGLGLSICKAIAEAMGGSVGFESTYGQGSLFWAEVACKPEVS